MYVDFFWLNFFSGARMQSFTLFKDAEVLMTSRCDCWEATMSEDPASCRNTFQRGEQFPNSNGLQPTSNGLQTVSLVFFSL